MLKRVAMLTLLVVMIALFVAIVSDQAKVKFCARASLSVAQEAGCFK